MEEVKVVLTESQIDELLGENQTYELGGDPAELPITDKGITSINLSPIDITNKAGSIYFNKSSATIYISGKSKADITVKNVLFKAGIGVTYINVIVIETNTRYIHRNITIDRGQTIIRKGTVTKGTIIDGGKRRSRKTRHRKTKRSKYN
jgi:hypothetical protein